jgi:hypothetical protein
MPLRSSASHFISQSTWTVACADARSKEEKEGNAGGFQYASGDLAALEGAHKLITYLLKHRKHHRISQGQLVEKAMRLLPTTEQKI